MEWWLRFAEGPLFRFTFTLMVFGLLINVFKAFSGFFRILRNSQNNPVPLKKVILNTFRWLIPLSQLRDKTLFTIFSIIFHIGVIIVPIFLFGHIELIRNSIGIGWFALNQIVADWLALITFTLAFIILTIRIFVKEYRFLSRFQDYLLIFLIGFVFFSGYLVSHPADSPLPYNTIRFLHVISGCMTFLLVPFSKLTHILFMPFMQLASELAWHFHPDSGELVSDAIGKGADEL